MLEAKASRGAYRYPANYLVHWSHIRKTVVKDTAAAVEAHIRTLPAKQRPVRPEPKTVVVQFRCDRYTYFAHREYGVSPFSVYNHLDAYCGSHNEILILEQSDIKVCDELRDCLADYLRSRCPSWTVRAHAAKNRYSHRMQDFYTMNTASVMVGAFSTFSFWAAFSAGNTTVIHPPMVHDATDAIRYDLNESFKLKRWTWDEQPVLTHDVGNKHGLHGGSPGAAVCEWLKEH
jgi:hypothetical protein